MSVKRSAPSSSSIKYHPPQKKRAVEKSQPVRRKQLAPSNSRVAKSRRKPVTAKDEGDEPNSSDAEDDNDDFPDILDNGDGDDDEFEEGGEDAMDVDQNSSHTKDPNGAFL